MHHHRSSRSRCRGGGDGASLSSVPAEGNFRIPQWLNSSRAASDSAHNISFSAGQNSSALKLRQSSSKKSSGIPIRELLDEELSGANERMRYSPSLVAKLMGLDTLPSSARKQKHSDGHCQTAASTDYTHTEDFSHRRTNEEQEFKDVFEVREMSEVKEKNNRSNNKRMLDCTGTETEVGFIWPECTSTKHLSTHEVHQNAKRFNNALFEIPDSSNDLFFELFQYPNSFFAKRLQDLKHAPPSPHRSKITILKPFVGAKNWSNEGWPRPSKSERNRHKCFDKQQEVRGSVKLHAGRLNELFVTEKSGSLPLNSSVLQHCHLEGPAHIVILKPNREKAQKRAVNSLITDDDFLHSSKKFRELGDPGIKELLIEGKQKLLRHREGSSNKSKTEIAREREIIGMTKNTRRRRTKNNFASEKKLYNLSSDNFNALSYSLGPSSPPYKIESSVNKEAKKRLSERWKITHQLQNRQRTSGGSSTLGELLALSDRNTSEITMDTSNNKKDTDENFACSKVLGRKVCSLGVNGQDGLEDVNSRFFPNSNSTPMFSDCRRPYLRNGKQDGGRKDVQNMGTSGSSDARFSKPENLLVKSSKHGTCNSLLVHFAEEENMLPEREIHINYEGLRKSIDSKNYLDIRTIDPLPTDCIDTDVNQPKNCVTISTLEDESRYLTGLEKIKEISSDHPQVEMLPSESNVAESCNLSFDEELEQSSPISVLETPSEDEAYISGCFDRLTSDLKELRTQLQLLKLESVDSYTEETEALWSSGDCYREDHGLFPSGEAHETFRDDNDRDFTYLLDVLVESGFHEDDSKKLVDACFLLGYPVSQNVFDELEKKYSGVASWPRSERRLLFDLINCTLSGLVSTSMDVHPGEKKKFCQRAWDHEGPVEAVWQMVVDRRNDESNWENQNKFFEQEWISFEHGADVIARGIAEILNDDLMEELVTEFVR